MWVDTQRRCWLHPDYDVHEAPGGTVQMRIQRRSDGFHVWPPHGEEWMPQRVPGYVSPADTVYLPVAELHD